MSTRLWSVVIDTADMGSLAAWWRDALGWTTLYEAADEVVIYPELCAPGEGDGHDPVVPALAFVEVPEPKTTKNRVHLDLASDSAEAQQATVDRLLAHGATRVDIGQQDVPWVVLADPEGNELCVLAPVERYRNRGPIAAIVVDSANPSALAAFWSEASGWPVGDEIQGAVSLQPPHPLAPDLEFVPVTDAKTVKNRLHLDVAGYPDDDRDAEVARLVALGARPVDVGQGPEVTWTVLADPEGNEFCVLRSR